MNKLILMAIVSLALTACAAPGSEQHVHDEKGAPGGGDTGKPMTMMQDNMLRMHEQMHKIMEAKDPNERARLMKEHRAIMQEHMKMMGGHDKSGMMGTPAAK
jgi:hypothetical protein